MRPGIPSPFFATEASRAGKSVLLAIGSLEEEGDLFCYRFERKKDGNINLLYLYYGDDRYQLWRSYMQALSEIEEEEGWQIEQRDYPRVSEVASI